MNKETTLKTNEKIKMTVPEEIKEYVDNKINEGILLYHEKNMDMLQALGDLIDNMYLYLNELMLEQITLSSLLFDTEEKKKIFEETRNQFEKDFKEKFKEEMENEAVPNNN